MREQSQDENPQDQAEASSQPAGGLDAEIDKILKARDLKESSMPRRERMHPEATIEHLEELLTENPDAPWFCDEEGKYWMRPRALQKFFDQYPTPDRPECVIVKTFEEALDMTPADIAAEEGTWNLEDE